MKVLPVKRSLQKESCTYTALPKTWETLEENGIVAGHFRIGIRPLSEYRSCGSFSKTGHCFMQDTAKVFPGKSRNYDDFVYGFPVHFFAIADTMASFMERAFSPARTYDAPVGKPAVPLQYRPMASGNISEGIRQDGEGQQIIRALGRNMAWMMKCTNAEEQTGITYPEKEARIQANFIR